MNKFDIEISGGLGELKRKVLRIGLMGYSSTKRNVVTLLGALREVLSTTTLRWLSHNYRTVIRTIHSWVIALEPQAFLNSTLRRAPSPN
ncbi:MAG: hypothetical protein A2Z14_06455 [Chloroflexi bacterium RBG_16_48_8]|nr:MAG: hypothetical protein A2Z14_06455 [Chloroflexi bacterium RBG_16_48_8]